MAVAPERRDALDESAAALSLVELEGLHADADALGGLVATEGSSIRQGLASVMEPVALPLVLACCRDCGAVRYVPRPGSGGHARPCPSCDHPGYMVLSLPAPRYGDASELREAFRRTGFALGMTLADEAVDRVVFS